MNIGADQLAEQVRSARAHGWAAIMQKAEKRHDLPAGLLLALASRETDMRDVVGDKGHGRGLFQIDDRSYADWLAAHGASGPATTPSVADAADLAASTLASNLAFARQNRIAPPDRLRFACSAYNAGAGGAIAGQRQGDCDLKTTGGDYGRDVLERQRAIRSRNGSRSLQASGGRILRKGTRGKDVVLLKRDLRAWFDRAVPGAWRTFRVQPGPAFGAGLSAAVRDFQQRNGLLVDGEVGTETRGALTGALPSRPSAARAVQGFPDLTLDAPKKPGSSGLRVRLIQGWLCLHGFKLVVDGGYGDATARQVRAFQTANGLRVTGVVDQATYEKLVQPMKAALSPVAAGGPLGSLVVACARQHLVQHPQEVGGENRGPWVRLYTQGQEGKDSPWCAGFATLVLDQACRSAGLASPLPRTLACDDLRAAAGDRFLSRPTPPQRKRITPGSLFLRPNPPGVQPRYAHTGIVVKAEKDIFRSIEGNTNDDGSAEGFEVCARVHGYRGLDFVLI